MNSRPYALASAIVFTAMALLQLTRAIRGWEVEIAGYYLPLWPSWIFGVVAASLAIWGFRLAARAGRP